MSGASSARSGEFVKQVLCEVPDIRPDGCEAKILAREVADAEITGDHGTSRRESDDESFLD